MIKLSKKERYIVDAMKQSQTGAISLDELLGSLPAPFNERKHTRRAMIVTINKLSRKLKAHFGIPIVTRHTKLGRANKAEFLIVNLIHEI